MATVSGTFTAVGLSAVLDVPAVDEEITISLTGTWVATVRLERELSPYSNSWEVIRSDTGNYSIVIKQIRKNERYRFNTVAFTSGTVTFSVADAVLVLTEVVDPNTGALLAHYDEDGFVVDGDFDVTGTFTPAGAVNVGGNLTVTGDIAVTGGDITSSSGAIAFGDENLSTTGTLAAGATTITGALSSTTTVSGVTGDFEVIEAGDASLGINGIDAAQGGAILTTGGTSSTAGNAGGAVDLVGGTPGATSAGGAVGATGGVGGATSGAGGAASLVGGAATAGDSAGGASAVTGGAAQGTSAGGAVTVTSGAAEDGVGVAPGASGAMTIGSGAAGTGTSGTAGASGAVIVESAAGGTSTTGTAGASGALTIQTGAGGEMQTSGTGAGGAAGDIAITAGVGGAETGSGAGTGGTGGDVVLTAGIGGTGNTAGLDGEVWNRGAVITHKLTVGSTITTDTHTVTVTELRAGMLVYNRTNDANATVTVPTGDILGAAFRSTHANEDTFTFHVINLGASSRTVTMTAADDFTIVGNAVVAVLTSATFLVRRTADTVYVLYRVAG